MKFIHTADLHLDSKIDGIPTEKSRIRREEILRTFERLVDFAGQNDVKAIIIAGDMFDGAKITLKAKERIIQCVKNHKDIDFLYLSGNHDKINFFSDEESFKNFIVFEDEWKSVKYDNVCITGVALNGVNQNSVYDMLKLEEQAVNVVVMHGQIVGYKSQEKAEVISLPKLKDKNIDYLALGHIHSYAEGTIDNRGKYAYSGCLDGRGFDELGTKGFVLIDVENNKLSTSFVPFSSRILFEEEFNVEDFTSHYDLCEFIINNLDKKANEKSLIKVVLKGERKIDFFLDVFSLEKRLNEKFFFSKVVDKTGLKIELSDYAFDKSVKGEFVRAVWESDLDAQEKDKIIKCGLSALKGEEM